jgi:hypothetical protein
MKTRLLLRLWSDNRLGVGQAQQTPRVRVPSDVCFPETVRAHNGRLRVSLRKARYEHMVSACAPMRDMCYMCLGDFGVVLERQNAVPRAILQCRASRRGMTTDLK